MPEIGKTISHYRILEKLGQGGMGEVFLAHDTSLDRKVALKFLPDIFSADPERLARFEREAKLLASLNHPNIATIHGLEQADGKRFLAMELVEGQTLAQQIERGPLPIDEALAVCRQIAEGLEAAHEKGVIHRDLKPANVKITKEGKVKILDFGLAKAFQGDVPAMDASKSPTLTDQMTQAGVILGTAAYMAPEQAKGKAVDKRADIWAYGCLLYECLSGKRAFEGETVTETLAAILKGEPDWDALPASTPASMTALLRGCLRKDLKQRFHDASDVRILIGIAHEHAHVADSAGESKHLHRMRWRAIAASIVGLLAIAVAGMFWISYKQPKTEDRITRFQVTLAPAEQLGGGDDYEQTYGLKRPSRTAFALTPDGKKLVFYGLNQAGKTQLYVREMDRWTPIPIEGTEGARFPFLSPDGSQVAFFADGRIQRIPLGGGQLQTICDGVRTPSGASWGDGNIIVYSDGSDLWQVPASGGNPTALVRRDLEKGDYGFCLPHFLPGGEVVLVTSKTSGNARIEALSVKDGKRSQILEEGADAIYVNSGYMVFARRGALYAVPFDARQLRVTGNPSEVLADVMQSMNAINSRLQSYAAQFSVSESGSISYVPGGLYPDAVRRLVTVDRTGQIQALSGEERLWFAPRISKDGRKIVYRTFGERNDIWVYDIKRNTSLAITTDGSSSMPIWHPDGDRVTFMVAGRRTRIVNLSTSGAGQPQTLIESPDFWDIAPGSWSEDGKTLAYLRFTPDTLMDIYLFHADENRSESLLATKYNEGWPVISPDGRWLAYGSDRSGKPEVYIQLLRGKKTMHQISNGCGLRPAASWGRGGKELYYPGLNNKMMVVEIPDDPDMDPGVPKELFDMGSVDFAGASARNYDVDSQGQRFYATILKQDSTAPGITRINVIQNWFGELKRQVPAK